MRSLCQRLQRQVIIRHGRFGDGRHPTRYYPSVPTQGYSSRCDTKGYTYHRYTLSASVVDKARRVTRCRDARSERPLYQKLQHRSFNDNGRTDRASLHRVTRLIVTRFALTQRTHRPCVPTKGYTFPIPTWKSPNRYVGKKHSPRGDETKLRRNQMKLRRKCFAPT